MKQKKGLRYAVCKRCREIWNIASTADTSRGYLCPNCRKGSSYGKTKNGRTNEGAFEGQAVYRENRED